jgi:hypothetical protein
MSDFMEIVNLVPSSFRSALDSLSRPFFQLCSQFHPDRTIHAKDVATVMLIFLHSLDCVVYTVKNEVKIHCGWTADALLWTARLKPSCALLWVAISSVCTPSATRRSAIACFKSTSSSAKFASCGANWRVKSPSFLCLLDLGQLFLLAAVSFRVLAAQHCNFSFRFNASCSFSQFRSA